jgi:flagellar FliL protein
MTLNTREGKEKLREETLEEVQKVLLEETGEPGVDNVFFTSFVMQ